MTGFILVHDNSDGRQALLNVHDIVSVYDTENETFIRMRGSGVWSVEEDLNEIGRLITLATKRGKKK